jgi:hypothetical chaperone protein
VTLGLDFGTTNSAVASEAGLARFPSGRSTFRSVLYFDADERGPDRKPLSIAGEEGIVRYLAEEATGRLIQSMKSYLASRRFNATQVFSSVYTLEDLIARLAKDLAAAARTIGDPSRVVVGRPVRFAGAESPEDEAFALDRLRAALGRAGFGERELVFEYEPVGAAYHYERGLDRDELVLIADFGGGTSDFSAMRVGPSVRDSGNAREILAVDGVALAGDAFDGRIVRHLVAPELGRGGVYVTEGKEMPVPPWLHAHLERWHHLSFLKSKESMALIDKIEEGSTPAAAKKMAAFRALIADDLGFRLARAVEQTKVELSAKATALFRFDEPGVVKIEKKIARADFEHWIAPELEAIAACVERMIAAVKQPIDRVFMTGGSSLVPAVRKIFADRFGEARLRSGDELTSVASGLALVARDRFA